jgi:hypothetical protein
MKQPPKRKVRNATNSRPAAKAKRSITRDSKSSTVIVGDVYRSGSDARKAEALRIAKEHGVERTITIVEKMDFRRPTLKERQTGLALVPIAARALARRGK